MLEEPIETLGLLLGRKIEKAMGREKVMAIRDNTSRN